MRLNGPKAAGKKIGLNIAFTDLRKSYGLIVENAVLNYGKPLTSPDASVTLTKATLHAIQLKETTVESATAKGDLMFGGRREAFGEFIALLDTFPLWFKIVTR